MSRTALLSRPVLQLRQRLQTWFESRIALTDSVTLGQRSVYILPTRPGLMLGLTLLVLLVASINYQLSLGYLLTFLLAGTALVGMHVCHNTLRGLGLSLAPPQPHYAGTSTAFDVKLINNRRSTRHGIGLGLLTPHAASRQWSWTDVPAQGSCLVQVAFTPSRRGVHRLPTLTAETRFPLGTFRVWTVWRPAASVMVYPKPEASPPQLPAGEPRAQGAAAAARSQGSNEFDGIRAYRRGDPIKNVLWKKAAKVDSLVASNHSGLVVRDSLQAQNQELWLDIRQTGLPDLEARLSRLCAWVLLADRLGLDYGLRLSAGKISPGCGQAHQRRCLEALATC